MDIIVLQETNGAHAIQGYDMYTQPSIQHNQRVTGQNAMITPTMVATYIRRQDADLPSIQHDTTAINTPTMEHVATSILLGDHRLHIINSYWLLNQPTARLPPLDMKLGPNRDRDTVVTLGDFNCQHPILGIWGHVATREKVTELLRQSRYDPPK